MGQNFRVRSAGVRPASGGRPSGNRTIIVRESYDGEHIVGSSGDHRQDAAGDPGGCRAMSGTWICSCALGIYSVNILYKALDAIMARPPQHLQLALLEQRLIYARMQFNIAIAVIAAEEERGIRRERQRRRWWVRPWLQRRPLYGQYETLMAELEHEHHNDFKSFLRMEPEMFYELLLRVAPHIEKNTAWV